MRQSPHNRHHTLANKSTDVSRMPCRSSLTKLSDNWACITHPTEVTPFTFKNDQSIVTREDASNLHHGGKRDVMVRVMRHNTTLVARYFTGTEGAGLPLSKVQSYPSRSVSCLLPAVAHALHAKD